MGSNPTTLTMNKYEDKYVDATHIDLSGIMVSEESLNMILALCAHKDYIKGETRTGEFHYYCSAKVPTGEIRTLHLVF